MNFKKLGNTDLKVSAICLGTMTWGEQNNQKEAFEQMDYSLESGINFFDVAEIYPSPCREETFGETERIIGKWINTSVSHNQHHQKFNGNYGLYFLFWDRWMGTLRNDYDADFNAINLKKPSN